MAMSVVTWFWPVVSSGMTCGWVSCHCDMALVGCSIECDILIWRPTVVVSLDIILVGCSIGCDSLT